MVPNAEIHGAGIAAQACCSLLRKFGCRVNTPASGAAQIPYLVINSVTATLIKDVFSVDACSLGGWEISRRLVVSHTNKRISEVTEPALVVRSETLRFLAGAESTLSSLQGRDAWSLFAGELPPQGRPIQSGKRAAWIFEASNTGAMDDHSTIFEFVPEGWFFWSPIAAGRGFLQLVLPRSEDDATEICLMLLKHTLVLKHVVLLGECDPGPLPCAPVLHSQLTGPNWIATGSSALRYDPISGDGTGASLRSAILACAVLHSVFVGVDPESCLEYYSFRLRRAFCRHLRACESLYVAMGFNHAWAEEFSLLRRLASSMEASLHGKTPAFGLRDYRLVPA